MTKRIRSTLILHKEVTYMQNATPGSRLAARMLDGLFFLLLILAPLLMVQDAPYGVGLVALSVLAGSFLQLYIMYKYSASVGKRLLGIYVSDSEGKPISFSRNFFLRELCCMSLLSSIPVIGTLYFIIDSFMVFSEDNKTIHDRICGTKVLTVARSAYREIL